MIHQFIHRYTFRKLNCATGVWSENHLIFQIRNLELGMLRKRGAAIFPGRLNVPTEFPVG